MTSSRTTTSIYIAARFRVNTGCSPLMMTRWCTIGHFHQFFTLLEYSLVGDKFSPRTPLTLKKKNQKISKPFFVLRVLISINNFDAKNLF
jgi:hypothetical protein